MDTTTTTTTPEKTIFILSLEDGFNTPPPSSSSSSVSTDEPTPSKRHIIETTFERLRSMCLGVDNETATENKHMIAYLSQIHLFYCASQEDKARLAQVALAASDVPLTIDTHLLLVSSLSEDGVATSDSIIGFTLFYLGRDYVNISLCFVHPAHRRQRIGATMIQSLVKTYGTHVPYIKADVVPLIGPLCFFIGQEFVLGVRKLQAPLRAYLQRQMDEADQLQPPTMPVLFNEKDDAIRNEDASFRLFYYPKHCGYCAKSEHDVLTHRCTGCFKVSYCSKNCQRHARPLHSRQCHS